ncbi:hypothetical protein pb186bvf_012465 [Paramecium bursaria]
MTLLLNNIVSQEYNTARCVSALHNTNLGFIPIFQIEQQKEQNKFYYEIEQNIIPSLQIDQLPSLKSINKR